VKLELRGVTVSAEGAKNSRRSWPVRRSLLVCLTDVTGGWGLGEAAPLPGYSSEAYEDTERALGSVPPEAVARALDTDDLRTALASVAALVPSSAPSARFALESAALDWRARRGGVSAPALLGAEADAARPLAALLGSAASPTLLTDAQRAFDDGYRCFKLKVGAPNALSSELSGAAELRAHFGDGVSLRLDANAALDATALRDAGSSLAALALELFEEPGGALPAGVPLGLDESLQGCEPDRAEALWQSRAARVIVLKPTALGGLLHCRQLAERAEAGGLEAVVSHAFEGPVAWRAAAALALALPNGMAHGLAPHGALSSWPGDHLPVVRGSLHAWSEPGLGYPLELAFP
jgi:o-succinylbenzoate synthase